MFKIFQVREEDPFAITITEVIPTSSIPQQKFFHVSSTASKINISVTSDFLIDSDTELTEPIKVLGSNSDIDTMDKIRSTTSSFPDQETIISKITSETTMALEFPEISEEIKITVPKQSKSYTLYAIAMFENFIKFLVLENFLQKQFRSDRIKVKSVMLKIRRAFLIFGKKSKIFKS